MLSFIEMRNIFIHNAKYAMYNTSYAISFYFSFHKNTQVSKEGY